VSECIHELDPGVCVLCNGRTPVRTLIMDKPEAVYTARYHGTCLRCDEPIDEGDELGLHRGIWIHLIHFEDGDVE
jgi:hypothetical protein